MTSQGPCLTPVGSSRRLPQGAPPSHRDHKPHPRLVPAAVFDFNPPLTPLRDTTAHPSALSCQQYQMCSDSLETQCLLHLLRLLSEMHLHFPRPLSFLDAPIHPPNPARLSPPLREHSGLDTQTIHSSPFCPLSVSHTNLQSGRAPWCCILIPAPHWPVV